MAIVQVNSAQAFWEAYPLGVGAEWQQEETQTMQARTPLNLSLVYQSESPWGAMFEYQWVKTESSVGNYKIQTQYNQVMVWARRYAGQLGRTMIYVGAGVGAEQATIEQSFSGMQDTTRAKPDSIVGLNAGLQAAFAPWILVSVEARMLFNESYSPNPAPMALTKFGFAF